MSIFQKNYYDEFQKYISDNGVSHSNKFVIDISLPEKVLNATLGEAGDYMGGFGNDLIEGYKTTTSALKILTGQGIDTLKSLRLMCESTELPALNIGVKEHRTNGDLKHIPYGNIYPELTFTFLLSEKLIEKAIMDVWADLIVNSRTHQVAYHDDIKTTILIHQLDNEHRKVYTIRLDEAFPKLLGSIALSHQSNGNINKLPVTFSYSSWHRDVSLLDLGDAYIDEIKGLFS